MKKQIVVGTLAITLLAGTGTGVYAYNQKVLAAEAAVLEQLRVETLENAEKAVDSLYNSTRTMLADDVETKIKYAEVAVEKVQEDEEKYLLSKEISQVQEIADVQQEVYSTLENGILVESITEEKLEEINQKLAVIKRINEPIFTHLTEYLSDAEEQLVAIDNALKKIREAEKSLNRNTYNSALLLVDEVKNEIRKDELKKQLEIVNEKITAMEIEAERKKEEEARIAAEKEKAEKAAAEEQLKQQQSSVSSNSTQPSSSSKTSSSKSNTQTSSTTKSTSESNQTSSGNKSSSSSSSSNSGSANKSVSNENKPAPSKPSGSSGSSSGGSNMDEIGKQLENHDWNKTGSGEIDAGGNTWETWD